MTGEELSRSSAAHLARLARAVRRDARGARVTYARAVRTTLARPGRVTRAALVTPDDVVEHARRGAEAGCDAVLLDLGGNVAATSEPVSTPLAAHGDASWADHLHAAASAVGEATGLLVDAEVDGLDDDGLVALRTVCVSQAASLDRSPRGLATLEAAGRLQIPFRVSFSADAGDRSRRLATLEAINDVHAAYGHVQDVLVRPGRARSPQEWARIADGSSGEEELAWTIAAARLVLAPEIHVQASPRHIDDVELLVFAGADDLEVSALTGGFLDPEETARGLEALEARLEASELVLAPRLAVHARWALDPERFVDAGLRFSLLDRSDAEGLARDHPWIAGGVTPPPGLVDDPSSTCGTAPRRRAGSTHGRIAEILSGVRRGQVPDEQELVALFEARGPEVLAIAETADELRAQAVGDAVTFVANRNINFTNVCTFRCRFCAFSKGRRSLELREAPYLLELEEITRRVAEAEALGATEVCLQGGIHPSFDGDSYLEVVKAVRAGSDRIHIHGFSALEVNEGARRLGEPLETYLRRLREAGLGSIPGTAAEILDDEVRDVLCPGKLRTDEWLETHRIAHRVGLRSNVTIMFGAVEQPRHWARHLVRTRALQRETGGFTEFVPLPFVHMATPIYLQRRARRGPTFREVLLVHAVGRIAYHGLIPNVQASWVKIGTVGLRQLLLAGCNDAGGTLMEESIARAAGAAAVPFLSPETLEDLVAPLGRRAVARTTLYERPTVSA